MRVLAGAAVATALMILLTLSLAAGANAYGPREDWEDYSGGNLNISVFVFRDANRNGIYDIGDRPMSGIIVEVMGNNRSVTARSNLSGFANYVMSATDPDGEITFAGPYAFHTLVPAGWEITTGNGVQRANFELMPGAPADLIARPDPDPVGMAPALTITGKVRPGDTVRATSPEATSSDVPVDAERFFSIASTPGVWELIVGAGTARLTVNVATTPVVLSDSYLATTERCGVRQEGANFDDLLLEGILKVPSGYYGLSWENFVMTHQKFYSSEGYRNNAMSGEFLAYNGSGHPASFFSTEPFDFVSGYFGASALAAEGETLMITGWRGDEIAYRQRVTLSALGAKHLLADFNCVTRVDFETLHYWQFTVDDLLFRLPR